MGEDRGPRAGEAAVQKAKPMEQNAYKISIVRSIIEEELQAIAQS